MASNHLRIDNLPMNRQVGNQAIPDAGKGSTLMGGPQLQAVYEKRDVDPNSMFMRRRHGSLRSDEAAPNLLGVTVDVNEGRVALDADFASDITDKWLGLCTIRITAGATQDSVFPLFRFEGLIAQIEFDASSGNYSLVWRFAATGNLQQTLTLGTAGDYRVAMGRAITSTKLAKWNLDGTSYVNNNLANPTGWVSTDSSPILFGPAVGSVTATLDQVVVTNFQLYNDYRHNQSELAAFAADLTPDKSGTLDIGVAYKLLWHENFSEGGDLFTYTNSDADDIESYLVPTNPVVDGTEIAFGGQGVVEIPFYLDFDEYYWTPVNASARYEWMFQIELKLPNTPLKASTVFEFQDIVRLDIVELGGNYYFEANYANGGQRRNSKILIEGGHYYVFVGRDVDNYKTGVQIVGGVIQTNQSAALLPAVFNYDQTLGFIIGDRVDLSTSQPFGGRITRFALHNNSDYAFSGKGDAVVYYDSSSIYGDQVIDRGNRSLNSYLGTRMSSAPPYYMQGGFPGGSYVAATGGYVMSSSTPATGYSGELRKSIKKDAVVQRRGNKSFLTSNGVSYVLDDFDQTFRPLGIPRPGTKVTCLPQGVGPIDGFVRYAYRYVTKDGTVGPAFDLDPVDARGGVNVFLGAEGFGLPGETPFGISYGQCQGYDQDPTRGLTTTDSVEHFVFKDTDGDGHNNLLWKDTQGKGHTLELAFRLSEADQFKETIFSQGVQKDNTPSSYADRFCSLNTPKTFPWIGQNQQECCFQFAFRFADPQNHPTSPSTSPNQVLFHIGAHDQHYETGNSVTGHNDHWRLNHLIVSIQQPADVRNTHSIMVCRDQPAGSNHRDNELEHTSVDYNFIEGHDYCVFVRRAGTYVGEEEGTALAISIYDHTVETAGGDGWAQWPTFPGDTEILIPNFWPANYQGSARDKVTWGAGCIEGSNTSVKTRRRATAGGGVDYAYVRAFYAKGYMYHGRMWRRDFPFTLLANKALERYGATSGTLQDGLEVDTAFVRDSSKAQDTHGWDRHNEIATPFRSGSNSAIDVNNVMTENVSATSVLNYGWDMGHIPGTPDEWIATSTNRVPLWIQISDRNEGSLAVGTGSYPLVEICTRKWYAGAEMRLFSDFAGTIDLEEFTWITLWFHHYERPGTTGLIDVYLERVFIDGNTGDWGSVFNGDPATPLRKNDNAALTNTSTGNYQYGLFTVGGLPGQNQKYDVEIAEVRMWDGERYAAEGGGDGDFAFGPYLSNRIPPNDWGDLIYYARFTKPDLDDEDNPTTMDQFGQLEVSGYSQKGTDAVLVQQQATVVDAIDAGDSTTTQYFVPFPEPPESSIRGIQIFRTQVVPVVDDFSSGSANPNAVSDAWRACRDAPLYFLTEIPRGNTSYTDTATDGALGAELEATTGLVPRNPGGIFEWKGYLGIFDTTQPRVFFAESPASWESFPLENLYDLPVREDGPIRAAIELASRDARNSRVLLLGKSYGVFLDGTPLQPVANTMGGGVGAWSQRCLVVEKGIAYAYNGTLWAISGDGQAEDIGLPVLDLLPSPEYARLSVSSTLGSLFVINEQTGLALRFHFARRQWYVEDRNALSCTDVDGVDQWVHVSGYPSAGATGIYQDDVVADTPASKVSVTTWSNASNTFTLASVTGVAVGMRVTLVNDRQTGSIRLNPAIRQTVTVASIAGNVVTTEEDLDIPTTWTDVHGDTYSVRLHAYIGVGYWGTMIDTGPFKLRGDLKYVDVGVDAGDDWWGAVQGSDYPADPANRTGFVDAESAPTSIVDEGGSGVSTRLGVNNNQRYERVLFWSPVGQAVGLTELELSYTTDPGEDK